MKNLIIILFYASLIGCEAKKDASEHDLPEINFQLDTVMIDPGNELLYLNAGLRMAALDEKKEYLYNFNSNDYTLEKINLNKGWLEEKLPFEKEGPNGVGNMVFGMHRISSNSIAFTGYQQVSLFGLDGEKMAEYAFNNVPFEGDKMGESESFQFLNNRMYDPHTMVGLIRDGRNQTYTLGILKQRTQSLKKVPLPLSELEHFRLILSSPSRIQMSYPSVFIGRHQENYIISNEVSNTIMVYDTALDSLIQINYQPGLTADKKTGKYKQDLESEAAFKKETLDMRREINFMAPVWDEEQQRFYRFSHKIVNIGNEAETIEDAESAVYLTVFDSEFNVMAESLVDNLTMPPGYHFVKDGKIWLYVNMEDELGFVCLDVDL